MAELATIARPYAEALFKSIRPEDQAAVSEPVNALAAVAGNAQLRQFADHPKARPPTWFSRSCPASSATARRTCCAP